MFAFYVLALLVAALACCWMRDVLCIHASVFDECSSTHGGLSRFLSQFPFSCWACPSEGFKSKLVLYVFSVIGKPWLIYAGFTEGLCERIYNHTHGINDACGTRQLPAYHAIRHTRLVVPCSLMSLPQIVFGFLWPCHQEHVKWV